MRAIAPNIPPHAEVLCRRRRRRNYGSNLRRQLRARRVFSCCGSVAALPALANCNERRGAVGNGPGTTAKYLWRFKIAAVGCGLGNTFNYFRSAASIGLGTTIKYLRRTTSAAAGNGLCTTTKYLRGAAGIGLGTTIKYLRRTTSATANNGLWAP